MFSNRKRQLPLPSEDIDIERKPKCFCPEVKTKDYVLHETNFKPVTESSPQEMETDSGMTGCNNNEQTEHDRNTHPPSDSQQHCRQCLAGQGGHFMHIYSDMNNNT